MTYNVLLGTLKFTHFPTRFFFFFQHCVKGPTAPAAGRSEDKGCKQVGNILRPYVQYRNRSKPHVGAYNSFSVRNLAGTRLQGH